MSTLIFVAHVTQGAELGYRASFPDFPELTCHAGDLAQLLVNARTAVLASLQELSDAGEAWPTPLPMGDASAGSGAATILVDVSVDDAPVRVNISIGERLLARMDAEAEVRGMTRSGFIAQAVRLQLGERSGSPSDVETMGRRIQDELDALGRRLNDSLGPQSSFGRRMVELDDYVFDGVRKAADGVSNAMARRKSASTPEPSPDHGDDHATR